jgi:hypothetical protein
LLATPAGAKNVKLGDEVLGDWCSFSSSERTTYFTSADDFVGAAPRDPNDPAAGIQCGKEPNSDVPSWWVNVRQNGYRDLEADCKAIKTEIVGHVQGATRGKNSKGEPLLPLSEPRSAVCAARRFASAPAPIPASIHPLCGPAGSGHPAPPAQTCMRPIVARAHALVAQIYCGFGHETSGSNTRIISSSRDVDVLLAVVQTGRGS